MCEHISACGTALKTKQDAFLPALKTTAMSDGFTRKWQMPALSAFSRSGTVMSARDLFAIDGGAACLAYMLTGQLNNAVLRIVMPSHDIFQYTGVLTEMCQKLGVLTDELEDITLDMEFLTTLKRFQGA